MWLMRKSPVLQWWILHSDAERGTETSHMESPEILGACCRAKKHWRTQDTDVGGMGKGRTVPSVIFPSDILGGVGTAMI